MPKCLYLRTKQIMEDIFMVVSNIQLDFNLQKFSFLPKLIWLRPARAVWE